MSKQPQTVPKTLAIRVQVSGRVQGVFFRAAARKEADDLDVLGWVRNCGDGRVEAHFQGAPGNVEAMVRWCHKGSPASHVTDVVTQACPPEDVAGFSIRG